MKPRITLFAAALWWGSLTTLGFLVVPLLFKFLPTPAMAGAMAAHLFTAQTWLSMACCTVLCWVYFSTSKPPIAQYLPTSGAMVFALVGGLLAMVVEWGIAPQIVARENLKLWHGLGSLAYVLQWWCGTAVLWSLVSRTSGTK